MLKGQVYKTNTLSNNELNTMYNLMCLYYDNFVKDNFIKDFKNKEDVILLKDENGVIKGFSTIVFYDIELDSKKYKILFSGDTIIDKDYWAKNDLAPVWLKYAIKKQREYNETLYWLLISKGYKTYKYLSTFFKEYYPNPDIKTPDKEQKIIDEFAKTFYPDKYDKNAGILVMNQTKDYLKEEYSKIPEIKKNDKIIQFFLQKNPKYYLGNELICITKLCVENTNNAGKRLLGI